MIPKNMLSKNYGYDFFLLLAPDPTIMIMLYICFDVFKYELTCRYSKGINAKSEIISNLHY